MAPACVHDRSKASSLNQGSLPSGYGTRVHDVPKTIPVVAAVFVDTQASSFRIVHVCWPVSVRGLSGS